MPNYSPTISVVMPTRNAENYLTIAIDSILNQSFNDFEFIIIDDYSTDRTPDILENYHKLDSRIQVIRNSKNIGVANSLNIGIAAANSPLIARMDSDDISLPNRFEKQLEFMVANPQVGVLGTQSQFIDEDGHTSEQAIWEQPTDHNHLIWNLICSCPICHPTVMMRTSVVRQIGGYNEEYPNEDMELWTRMAFVTRLTNLDECLLLYRMPPKKHEQKQDFWEPHIKKVGFEYVQAILERKPSKVIVDTFIELEKYNYTYFSKNLSLITAIRISLLLDRLHSRLKSKQLLEPESLDVLNQVIKDQKRKLRLTVFKK